MCQHSNINLANHQGIMEELWIHELDGFITSLLVKASLPGGVDGVEGGRWSSRLFGGLLFAKEVRNWEFVKQKSHSE